MCLIQPFTLDATSSYWNSYRNFIIISSNRVAASAEIANMHLVWWVPATAAWKSHHRTVLLRRYQCLLDRADVTLLYLQKTVSCGQAPYGLRRRRYTDGRRRIWTQRWQQWNGRPWWRRSRSARTSQRYAVSPRRSSLQRPRSPRRSTSAPLVSDSHSPQISGSAGFRYLAPR